MRLFYLELPKIMKTKTKKHVRTFQPQFQEAVKSGVKSQTIRKTPKRAIMAGDHLSLRAWSDKPYRSKQVILKEVEVLAVKQVEIFGDSMHVSQRRLTAAERDEVARQDGFANFDAMVSWFRKTHGLPFEGVMIMW